MLEVAPVDRTENTELLLVIRHAAEYQYGRVLQGVDRQGSSLLAVRRSSW